MKKLFAILLLVALLLTAVSCSKDATPDGMMNVSTEAAKFNLYVPESWISTLSSGISGARVASESDYSNVTATAYYPDEEMTAETYFTTVAKKEFEKTLPEFEMVDSACGDTTLGGRDAKRYTFLFKMDGTVYEMSQVMTVKDTLVYILTFTSPSDKYNEHIEEFESIRSAFTFR